MRKILIILTAMFLISIAAIAASADDNGKEKVRVIAHTDKEISDAMAKGCKVVREAKTLKALVCSKDAATSLGLQEDVKVFAVDAGANAQIRADLVQASGNTGVGRKVVVLDTGYNYYHQELNSSYLGGKDFVNDDLDPLDDNGHGSHVAGIITADGMLTSAKGVAPATGILAGKVLSASGGGYFSDVVAAIYWAVDGYDGIPYTQDDFNADAISMSLGTGAPYLYRGFCDNVLPDLTTAIQYALSRGVIVVVAAGNSGNSGVSIPGCISYSTAVGAVDSGDNIAWFSGTGDAVDITAPGVDILSSWLGTSYYVASGTSMATPMVSGVVTLIKFAHPDYTVAQVQDALFQNAIDFGIPGKDSTFGWGRADAYDAVAPPADTTPPVISSVQVSGIMDTSAAVTWTTDESSDSLVRYGTAIPASTNVSASSLVKSHSITLTGLSPGTTYYFEVQSGDASGNIAVDNNGGAYYSFTTLTEKPMHVASITMSATRVRSRTYATAAVTIVDASGIPVQDATVHGRWSGLTSDIDSGKTDTYGRVTLISDQVKASHGTFTFTVNSVEKTGWVYNQSANVETSDSITV